MFVHQDIDLKSDHRLQNAEKILDSLRNLGISGIAGASENKKEIISNIENGVPAYRVSKHIINSSVKVQSLDECLLIIPKSIFNVIQFDNITCPDWHLYGVEFCLNIKKCNKEVYVIPLSLYHLSAGYSFSKSYYMTLKKISKKHKEYKRIITTYRTWSTNSLILQISIYLNWIERIILNFMVKIKVRFS